jgi:CubicO group peptidase (beta-lactamase class C family)
MEIWPIVAPQVPIPLRSPKLPHDANSRAGMRGHAGFGASAEQLKTCLERWISGGWPSRMAVEISKTAEGLGWGLGLHRAHRGAGRYAELLARVPADIRGVHLVVDTTTELSQPAPLEGPIGEPSEWWMHTGFTGPVFFVRPADGCCIAILCHRRGSMGELLDAEQLRARRWAVLERLLSPHGNHA